MSSVCWSVSFHVIAFSCYQILLHQWISKFSLLMTFVLFSLYNLYILLCVQNNIHSHIHITQFKSKSGNKFTFMLISCRRNNIQGKGGEVGGRGKNKITHLHVCVCARTHTKWRGKNSEDTRMSQKEYILTFPQGH